MRKLKFIIVPVLLLAALVLIGASCGEEDRKRSRDKDEDKEKYLTYESERWRFEIEYPEDWEKKEDDYGYDESAVFFISPLEDEDDEDRENLLVYASIAQADDFDELMAGLIEDLSEGANSFDYERVMVSGYPGYKASYIYDEIQYLHYFINAGDTWYQILYVALESTYSQYIDQVETMIDSFEIE